MISIQKASAILQEYAELCNKSWSTEQIPLGEAYNRIIAEDARSRYDIPSFDNSAMDGYVLNTEDIVDNLIKISGEITAGTKIQMLKRPNGMQIYTGAPVPYGADAVVPFERTSILNNTSSDIHVLIDGEVSPADHIRRRGLSFSRNDLVAARGTRLGVGMLTVMASAGLTPVTVYKKLRVAIGYTGDELASTGAELMDGQIYESNITFLHTACSRLGVDVTFAEHIPDTEEATRDFIEQAALRSDCIITSGGVSEGKRDFLSYLLKDKNFFKILFRKVAVKPGKPTSCALLRNGSTPVFCLPGNPMSACITFLWLVVPFIQSWMGVTKSEHTCYTVAAPENFSAQPRTRFLFAQHEMQGSSIAVRLMSEQSSAAVRNIGATDGALIIPADMEVTAGTPLQYFPFSQYI